MSNKLKEKITAYGMVLPAFLVVILTVAYPIVSAIIQSFQDSETGSFTFSNYTYFFQINHLLHFNTKNLQTQQKKCIIIYIFNERLMTLCPYQE